MACEVLIGPEIYHESVNEDFLGLLIGSGGSKPCLLSSRTYSKGLRTINSVGNKHTCQNPSYLKT